MNSSKHRQIGWRVPLAAEIASTCIVDLSVQLYQVQCPIHTHMTKNVMSTVYIISCTEIVLLYMSLKAEDHHISIEKLYYTFAKEL